MTLPKPYYERAGITIYNSDCRLILPHVKADCVVTDPPYGIALKKLVAGKFKDVDIAGDGDTEVRDSVLSSLSDLPAIVFGSWKAPRPLGLRTVLVWEKGDHIGAGDLALPWRPNTEEVYVIGAGFAGHRSSSVLRFDAKSPNFTPEALRFHPTEKPIALMRALVCKCPPGTILDPFMGSGTTLVAAKLEGRKAIGIEIEEKYCRIAVQRLSQEVFDWSAKP